MRFTASQTTPSFFNQRSQLRMMSYVGLLSLVMVMIAMFVGRSSTHTMTGDPSSTISKHEPTSPVQQNNPTQKLDHVVIVGNPAFDGIIELASNNSDDSEPYLQLVADRSGMFRRRTHERDQETQMFLPRSQQGELTEEGDELESDDAVDDMPTRKDRFSDDEVSLEDQPAIPLSPERGIDLSRPFEDVEGLSDGVLHNTEVEKRETPRRNAPTFDERDLEADEFLTRPSKNRDAPPRTEIFEDEESSTPEPVKPKNEPEWVETPENSDPLERLNGPERGINRSTPEPVKSPNRPDRIKRDDPSDMFAPSSTPERIERRHAPERNKRKSAPDRAEPRDTKDLVEHEIFEDEEPSTAEPVKQKNDPEWVETPENSDPLERLNGPDRGINRRTPQPVKPRSKPDRVKEDDSSDMFAPSRTPAGIDRRQTPETIERRHSPERIERHATPERSEPRDTTDRFERHTTPEPIERHHSTEPPEWKNSPDRVTPDRIAPDRIDPVEVPEFTDEPKSRRRPTDFFGDSKPKPPGSTFDDEPSSHHIKRSNHEDPFLSDDSEPFRKERASVHIDKSYLDLVEDNHVGILKSESKSFYWLLDHARRVSASELERAGLKDVQYINLISEPSRYRGEPITIEGDLWKLYEFDATPNTYGVERLYEGWVFTGDSGNHPYRIVCTRLGKGIQPGENLRIPVRITGYFFKREGYQSVGGVHIAPTLLAKRIAINPMPNGIPQMTTIAPYAFGAIMAIGLALLVSVISFAISDERSQRLGVARWRREPQLSFSGVTFDPQVPVEQSLQEYAEQQRLSAISGAYGPLMSRQTMLEHGVREDSPSRTPLVNEGNFRLRRQSTVLQDWATRQKQALSGSDTFVATAHPSTTDTVFDEELRAGRLAPARHPLNRPETWKEPHESNLTPVPAPAPAPARRESSVSDPHTTNRPKYESQTSTASAHKAYETRQAPPVSSTPAGNSISYGASKLSEWEEEIAKMTNRDRTSQDDTHSTSSSNTNGRSAEDQIEQDRLIREGEIRERMMRQNKEIDRMRLEQIEQDRLNTLRVEFDRQDRYESDRDPLLQGHNGLTDAMDDAIDESMDYEESEYDVNEPASDDSSLTSTRKKRGGGWGWPQRRNKGETEKTSDTPDESASDGDSNSSSGDSSSSGGWGRRRKRSKRWRDGH